MKTPTTLVAALLPALLTAVVTAQDVKPDALAEVPTKPRTQFVMPAGETSIQDLVDNCATHLGINILTNSQECAHAQTIRLQKPIATDNAGCRDLLTGLLYRAGFALTSVDEDLGLYEVIMTTGARGREVMNRAKHRTVQQVLQRPNLKVAVTAVVELKHINAQLANNALRPFFASTGGHHGSSLQIGNVGSASSLLLSGMQDQVAQAIRMIKLCDVPQPKRELPGGLTAATASIKRLAKRVAALEKKLAEQSK